MSDTQPDNSAPNPFQTTSGDSNRAPEIIPISPNKRFQLNANFFSRLKPFWKKFRSNRRILIAISLLIILFFGYLGYKLDSQTTPFLPKKITLAQASEAYYFNFPVNDPLRFIAGNVSSQQLQETIKITPQIPFTVEEQGPYLVIKPQSGLWARQTSYHVEFPSSIKLNTHLSFVPGYSKNSLKFTTTGTFQLAQTYMNENIAPQTGLTVRFNYRLKDPSSLHGHITIDPAIPFQVKQVESTSPMEDGMMYRIYSQDMEYSKSYQFTFDPQLLSDLDETLGEEATILAQTIKNPHQPSVKVASGNYRYTMVVSPEGEPIQIPIVAQNTSAVEAKLYQINPEQAINYLVYTQEEPDHYWSKELTRQIDTSNNQVVWNGEVSGEQLSLPINIGQIPVGVYLLDLVASNGSDTENTNILINVTNIGAVNIIGKYQNAYWVSNLNDGSILGSANFQLYNLAEGANQIQSLNSNADGIVTVPNQGEYDLAVIYHQNDIAFIPVSLPESQMDYASQERRSYWWYTQYPDNQVKDVAYLYTDRPIYKPGDQIHAKAIVRQDRDAQYTPLSGQEFTLALKKSGGWYDPDQKPVWQQQTTSSSLGTVWEDIQLPKEFKTGFYYLSLTKDQEPIESIGIYVDEYRKPLYDLQVSTDTNQIVGQEKLKFTIQSAYTFGLPVANKEVQWKIYANEYYSNSDTDPYAKSNNGYYSSMEWWYHSNSYYGKDVANGTVKLNAEGQAVIEVAIDPNQINHRTQDLTVEVSQIDEQLTPEKAVIQLLYLPSAYQGEIVTQSQDPDDKFITLKLTDLKTNPVQDIAVTLSTEKEEITTQQTQSDGLVKFQLNKDHHDYGYLTFSWQDPQGNQQTLRTYYSTYNSSSEADILEFTTREAQVELTSDLNYQDTANLKVSGGGQKHLVVFGRESVIDTFIIDEAQDFEFDIADSIMPNAYLFTYSFKDGQFITSETPIEPSDLAEFRKINIEYSFDQENYQPGEDVTLEIYTTDAQGNPIPAEVSVGVVDKAIYQLKKKAEEPIHPFFYKRRNSQTYLAENLSGLKQYEGGGGGGGGGPEAQVRSQFADTAFYQPNVLTDANGFARIEFTLPDNITTWLVTSYAVNSQTYVGQAETEFLVVKDVFATPIFPQFVTTGDYAWFRSILTNNRNQPAQINASFAFGGRPPVHNATYQTNISSKSNQLAQWQYPVSETDASRETALLISEGQNTVIDGISLQTPINPQGVTIQTRNSGIGSQSTSSQLLSGTDNQASQVNLYVHGSILGYINDILSYQAGYPYGCVEQTMSRFYPTLLVKRYVNYVSVQDTQVMNNLDDMVTAGIERLQKLQHDDGGWGLWEYDESSIYYTAYVMNGLLDLQDSIEVPDYMLDNAKAYLEEEIANGSISSQDKLKAFIPLSRMNSSVLNNSQFSFSSFTNLDDQQLAEITLAYARIDYPDLELALTQLKNRADRVSDQQVKWKVGTDSSHFAHENLSTALAIQALLETEPSSELIPQALNYLNTHRNRYIYGSTYTNAQVAKAFVEYVRIHGVEDANATINITQNGQTVYTGQITNPQDTLGPISVEPGQQLTINTQGSNAFLWELVTDHTFSGKLKARESEDFKISRSYTNVSRSDGTYKVGDVIKVSLQVTSNKSQMRNLVVEDHLPAGFEALNPSLDNETGYVGGNRYYQSYTTERYADRVVMFPTYLDSNQTFTYYARAYLPGKYIANPATVSLMYTPSVPAFSDTMEISIAE